MNALTVSIERMDVQSRGSFCEAHSEQRSFIAHDRGMEYLQGLMITSLEEDFGLSGMDNREVVAASA